MNYMPEFIPSLPSAALTDFTDRVADAVAELKGRLEAHYQRAFPDKAALVRAAIAEAEVCAWHLSFFPHLFLPDLVEARIAELALQPDFAPREALYSHAA